MRWPARMFAIALLALAGQPARSEITSYAIVNDDGSLRVRHHTIWLYGIYIPPTNRICRSSFSPIRCAPRAVLQLDTKIDRFVHCERMGRNADRSIVALCRVKGEDLGAWMIANGWAVALPDAPFEYTVLERIARERHLGVWGMPVDDVRVR